MRPKYLTPGPSELYYTVDFHLRNAIKEGIPSISHRSSQFQEIYADVKEKIKLLLQLPDDFQVLFTSSATEIWERIAQNLVETETCHFSNGAFADKFIEACKAQGKSVIENRVPDGQAFALDESIVPDSSELISITQNETSIGYRFPLEDLKEIRKMYPRKLIAIDAVSSLPFEKFDFNDIDTLYFSVQKCFGLPAGLGVWLVNERCVKRSNELAASGTMHKGYHSLPSLIKHAAENQTPETPNILNIYLLSQVLGDMLEKGVDQIRREIEYKAALLYNTIEENPEYSPFIKNIQNRSKTVAVFEGSDLDNLQNKLRKNGLIIGSGYGKYKQTHLRIANFPTHSKESFEQLVDIINS